MRPRSGCHASGVSLATPTWHLLALAVALIAAPPLHEASAQSAGASVPAQQLPALSWRNLGPFRAGRVSAVSGVIGEPGTFYAGFPGGGLWKTTSAGQVWEPVFDSVREVSSIGAVEVAPSSPNVVYVGTGDMITGGTLDRGNGVYKSTNAGRTWQHLGLADTRHIQTLLVDPRDQDVLLVGALGDHIEASPWRGVFRSTDGGRSFTKTLFIDDSTGIAKLARALDEPDVIFATSMRHWTPPGYAVGKYRSWQFGNGVGGTDIYKSTDGGVTWRKLSGPTVPTLTGRTGIVVAQSSKAQRVYVISDMGLWRSDDSGATWQRMAADDARIKSGQGGYSSGVWTDPFVPDVVYTINTAAYKSVDGGRTFTGMLGAPGGDDPQQLWISPIDGSRMIMGLDQGATVSLDGGETWSGWYNQSTEQLYHLATDNSWPYWIYASQQDAGAIRTRVRGNMGAVTMFDWNPVPGWEWGTVVPDPRDPNTVFASGNGIVRISYPSEQNINVSPAMDPAITTRVTPSQPLLWAPWNSRLLLAGTNHVFGTTNGGASWTRMSPDLGLVPGMDAKEGAKRLGGYGAIESLAASSVSPGEIWAGTDNGRIHVTRDTGRTWRDVSISALPNARVANISSLEASHRQPGTAYAAVEYLRSGDHKSYLFRTRDWGRTWTRITTGLPTDEPSGSFARVLREDPQAPGLLFAGTESGIHVSFDDGDHWQSLQRDLPNTPVRDLTVKGHDLIIATHGRGLWVLDDISPLRALRRNAGILAGTRVALYQPDTAIRVRRNVNQDTPLHREIPHAANPADGVALDFWLPQDAARVTIEIIDAAGDIVRHYASDPIAPVAEAARPPHPNFWVAEPQPLPRTSGSHRVHWDLRYDNPPAFVHTFEINANPGLTPASPIGPLVRPGRYTVRLTASGDTVTRSVVVRNDPRVQVSAAAIERQAMLQRRIMDAMRHSYEAGQQVVTLRDAIRAALSAPNVSSDARAQYEKLRAAVDSAVGGADASSRTTSSPGRFGDLNEALAGQLNAQDFADLAPTSAMYAAFTATCRTLTNAQAAWRVVISDQVPVINRQLVALGVAEVPAPRVITRTVCR